MGMAAGDMAQTQRQIEALERDIQSENQMYQAEKARKLAWDFRRLPPATNQLFESSA